MPTQVRPSAAPEPVLDPRRALPAGLPAADLPTSGASDLVVRRGTTSPRVLAVLLACDGDRWLPRTLEALAAQTRAPDALVAVDAGSSDASAALLSEAAGGVLRVSRRAGVLDAARAAMVHDDTAALDEDAATGRAREAADRDETGPPVPELVEVRLPEWVWLLHDDSAPAPDALEQLLAAVEVAPSVGVAGAKLRDWNDPRRLQEVGFSTSRMGRRITGVERGDLDQGQRDDREDVLAVSTAGMLVRRDLLQLLGGDDALPLLGEDLDLCRRARLAGARVVVVPSAVVLHADATRTGQRDTATARRGSRWASRRHEVHLRLVSAPLLLLPLVVLAALAGGVVRALGRVSAKQPGLAPSEITVVLAALTGLLRPGRVWRARASAARTRRVPARALAGLRADRREVVRWHRDRWQRRDWSSGEVPYEAGEHPGAEPVVFVDPRARGTLLSDPDAVRTAADATLEQRHAAQEHAPRRGRAVLPLLLAGLTAVSVLGLRGTWGEGSLTGPALAPAPSMSVLWDAVTSDWSSAGLGAALPADPWLALLAVLSAIAGGSPPTAVVAVVLLALPLAGLSGWAAAGLVTRARALRLVAALVWAAGPPLLAALDAGRLGAVVAHVALPWIAVGTARAVTATARRHALTHAAGAGLAATAAVAGAPVLLPVLVVVLLAVAVSTRRHATALGWTLVSALALSGPLLTTALTTPRALVADPGTATAATGRADAWQLLLAQPQAPGAGWVAQLLPAAALDGLAGLVGGAGDALGTPWAVLAAVLVLPVLLLLAAVLAVLTGGGRAARAGWWVVAVGLAVAAVSAGTAVAAPATTGWPGAGTSLVLFGTAAGALVGAERWRRRLRAGGAVGGAVSGAGEGRRAGHRALHRASVALVGLLPLVVLAGWVLSPSSQLQRTADPLPAVAADAGSGPDAVRTLDLDLRGIDDGTVTASVGRGRVTLVDSSAARTASALTGGLATAASAGTDVASRRLQAVAASLAAGGGDPREALGDLGIGYVFVRSAEGSGGQGLDGVEGLVRAGATDQGELYRVTSVSDGGVGAVDRPARARLLDADGSALAVLPSTGEDVRAQVAPAAAGSGARTVVLAERADSGWRATLDGQELTEVLVDDWAVGFEVPEAGGQLVVRHDGALVALWPWVQGLVLLLTLLLALPVPGAGRRRTVAP